LIQIWKLNAQILQGILLARVVFLTIEEYWVKNR